MTNVFEDVNKFGTACDQPASEANYKMYLGLIDEEVGELVESVAADDKVEQLDALAVSYTHLTLPTIYSV